MTPQEIFDTAYHAVVKQGRASRRPGQGLCLYRGPDNSKCAVGHLISDDLATHWDAFDNSGILYVVAASNRDIPDFIRQNLQLLADMQAAHDTASAASFVLDFQRDMRSVATKHGLTFE